MKTPNRNVTNALICFPEDTEKSRECRECLLRTHCDFFYKIASIRNIALSTAINVYYTYEVVEVT